MKVICIKTHSQGIVIKDKIYTVNAVDTCECGLITYDVGIKAKSRIAICICDKTRSGNVVWWISSHLFAEIDESFATDTLERIKEEIKEECLINLEI